METQKRPVIISTIAETDIQNIYLYGVETFGKNAAETFKAELLFMIRGLRNLYEIHPECRFLVTKSRMYRNIIFGSYLALKSEIRTGAKQLAPPTLAGEITEG